MGASYSPPEAKEDANDEPSIGRIVPSRADGFKPVGPAAGAGFPGPEDKGGDV